MDVQIVLKGSNYEIAMREIYGGIAVTEKH